jgi:hypothetical protein
MSLAGKAMVVSLNISQSTFRKFDQRATSTVESTYATTEKVGNYNKKLLPGAVELEEVHRIGRSIREYYYEQTLPWMNDGSRIISSRNYLDFTNAYRKRKGEWEQAVATFMHEYPALRDEAKIKLGDLYAETDYPTVAQLAHKFSCEVAFMPVPDIGDFRVEVLDSEKEAFLNRMREVESNAMRECWRRLYDVVQHAVGKLQTPGAQFKNTLIENITDMCKLLPRLNVTDDPELENMRRQVETLASKISPDMCRSSDGVRSAAASALADTMSKMSAYMGS